MAPKVDPFANLIGFNCRLCGTRMHSPPDLVGRKAKCPDCYALTVIPPPPEPPKSLRPKAMDEETYEVYEGEQPHGIDLARAAPPSVSFHCRLCQTHLSAEASRAGEGVVCPDCGATTPVPAMAIAAPKFAVTTEVYDVDGAAVPEPASAKESLFELYVARPPLGYRTPAEEDNRLGPRDDVDTQPASATGWGLGLLDGLGTAFAQSSILLAWLGLSIGLLIVVLLVGTFGALVGNPDQTNMLTAIIMLGTVVFTTSLWVTVAATIYWAVMDGAATGARRVHSWPRFDVADWMPPATTVVFAVVIAAIPGTVVAQLIPGATSLPWPLDSGLGWSLVGAMLVFPVVVLSQLNEVSMWAILSPEVLRTMWHAPVTWLAFYAATFGLAIGSMWIAEDLAESMGLRSVLVITPLEVFVDLLYAWLLGRLAWIAGAATPREGTTKIRNRG